MSTAAFDLKRRVAAGTLRSSDSGREVVLYGWVQKRRDFGELIFIDLRDRSGLVQIVFDLSQSNDAAMVEAAKQLRSEYVIAVEGRVADRDADKKNPRMPTGEVEIVATQLRLLNVSETPPFLIEEESNASEDLRLKHRYLDLRRPPLARNMQLRDRVTYKVRDYMHRNGFLEVETPILTKSTPEGARDYLVPSRVQRGEFYALPQSPQLFKQLLMVSGFERYYQIAKCFRDEDLRSDRQPEFTQIDIEASFIDEEFIIELIEGMFAEIFPEVGIPVNLPFPRMTWHEAMDRFGIDRPDLRFGMEIADLTAAAADVDFAPFKNTITEGGTVRGITVPGKAGLSRKRLDELTEYVKQLGATGLVYMKFDAEGGSSIKKFVTPANVDALRAASGARDGDLLLIVAGTKKRHVLEALGSLRLKVAREEGLVPENGWKFVWVMDFPLLEYDEEGKRHVALHHPFTSPALDQIDRLESDPSNVKARAYDVVLNGTELGGGSMRIFNSELQSRMFRALGIGDEEAKERFGFLLDAFRYGAPPHGGIALGLDRLVMLMARSGSIRDVIAFPKTTSGQDLMTEAPSTVDRRQLDELGIALKKTEGGQ